MQKKLSTAIVWLRNDLRFQDQQSFFLACHNHDYVFAYYAFEPKDYEDTQWGFKKTGKFRLQFLIQTLNALKAELAKNNITLITEKRSATLGIPFWVKNLKAKAVYFQKEWTYEEIIISKNIENTLSKDIEFHCHHDQFLYHPDDIPMDIIKLPQVFTEFRKKCEKYSLIRAPFPQPKILTKSINFNKDFEIPSLSNFGYDSFEMHPHNVFPFIGGTDQALNHLNYYFWETQKLSYYKKTRNGLLGSDYSSKFSPWLSLGSISVRTIYDHVKKYEVKVAKNESTYWLIFELIWRDYFKYVSLKYGNKLFQIGGILDKKYCWKTEKNIFGKWVEGRTSEPFVNANMLELKKTGFMSNRGRQNVASYFSKNMLMDWRMGAAYFENQLIDYDVHSNWGNWMYVSGVGNDPRDRKFNIKFQAERYDPKGLYQKRWLQKTLFE